MQRWKRDFSCGVIFLVLSVFGYLYSFGIREGSVSHPLAGSGVYVRLWMILLGLLSVILIFKSVKVKSSELCPKTMLPMSYFTIFSLIAYLAAMPYLGYTISTIMYLTFMMTAYQYYPVKGTFTRHQLIGGVLKYAAISAVITVFIAQVFIKLLVVILPEIALFN